MESNDRHINDCIKAVCITGDDLIKFKPDLEAAGVYEKCEKFVAAFQEIKKQDKVSHISSSKLNFLAKQIHLTEETMQSLLHPEAASSVSEDIGSKMLIQDVSIKTSDPEKTQKTELNQNHGDSKEIERRNMLKEQEAKHNAELESRRLQYAEERKRQEQRQKDDDAYFACQTIGDYRRYLINYTEGEHVAQAKEHLDALSKLRIRKIWRITLIVLKWLCLAAAAGVAIWAFTTYWKWIVGIAAAVGVIMIIIKVKSS